MSLNEEQQARFDRDGYVLLEGVLDPERDLDPVLAEYERVLDRLASELYEAGSISTTYAELPFQERLTRVYAESGRVHAQYFDFSLPQRNVTEDTPMWTGPAVFRLLRHEALLDAMESLIGAEIFSNPVQHVRLKPPEHLVPRDAQGRVQLGATPWHQDNGVVTEEADETQTITVWFPLLHATEEMGALKVVPGSHREGLLAHCPSKGAGGLHVPSRLFRPEEGRALPMRRGSVLLMHRRTLHSSLPNTSDQVRCSLDLRYHPTGQPTGRSAFPGFVARSRRDPASELRDPTAWTRLWKEARRAMASTEQGKFNRWDPNAAVCA